MTYPVSGFDDSTHISTTVKWYDPAKGYGFLVPDDGSPDIYCRAPALAAVGLETLLPGAAVACETAQGLRGPEVLRIISVDFSTTTPRQAPFAKAQGNGRMSASPGTVEAIPAASGRTIRAIVKWFHPVKGYGFLEPEDGSADVFCHLTVAQASGHDTLPQGAVVNCEIPCARNRPAVVILTESAVDAISARSLRIEGISEPGAVVASTAGIASTVPPWIEDWKPKRIVCAYDADSAGDAAADRLAINDPRVIRLRPRGAKDWNEILMRSR